MAFKVVPFQLAALSNSGPTQIFRGAYGGPPEHVEIFW